MRKAAALLFTLGLLFLLSVMFLRFELGQAPMRIGKDILAAAPEQVGAANIVTSVVLGYRGLDTLGEIAILFTAATATGLILSGLGGGQRRDPEGGFILRHGADLVFPFLMLVGMYIVVHGHLTPGGGFQGGVVLAAAFFLPLLARPSRAVSHSALGWIEGLAGASFIVIGLWALTLDQAFMTPWLHQGVLGELFSAGTLPLLYLALGLKVGAELASLLAHLAEVEASE
ncbi:MAG: sodium:proton antiporter [Gammaproteobacteria bacterium]|nr:sodium:proton antiporter [Gammaproteobacteria bacterium]MCP5137744.1 sodium:proton antiporter [Gammaproteobacteria bacterium]